MEGSGNVYSDVEKEFVCLCNDCYCEFTQSALTCELPSPTADTKRSGRPAYHISKEVSVELRGFNFSWCKISDMFGVSKWTVMRRVLEYRLSDLQEFSNISDDRIDNVIKDFISRHGSTTGEPFMSGYFHSLGLHVQRNRIRAAINRVDPRNIALRWGALVLRRKYYVPWPNSLWHVDGHHALIRRRFVVHGCFDGKSRKTVFLKCCTNNLADKDSLGPFQGYYQGQSRLVAIAYSRRSWCGERPDL